MQQEISELDKVSRLVAKALGQLTARERDSIVRFLLKEWLGQRLGYRGQPPTALEAFSLGFGPEPHAFPAPQNVLFERRLPGEPTGRAPEIDLRMVPIRLPEDLYQGLKAWTAERGFSMATVVRGLVERFLEGQGRPGVSQTRSPAGRVRRRRTKGRGKRSST